MIYIECRECYAILRTLTDWDVQHASQFRNATGLIMPEGIMELEDGAAVALIHEKEKEYNALLDSMLEELEDNTEPEETPVSRPRDVHK